MWVFYNKNCLISKLRGSVLNVTSRYDEQSLQFLVLSNTATIRSMTPQPRDISLTLSSLDQLLVSTDLEVFPSKGVDDVAHDYLFDEADKIILTQPLRLTVFLPAKEIHPQTEAQISTILQRFFAYQEDRSRKDLSRTLWQGKFSFVVATLFVSASLGIAAVLRSLAFDPFWHQALLGGLTIAAWVAFWQPIEILLYDWRPVRHDVLVYRKLSEMEVRVVAR